jgi:5'-methylthioadenosine phosphorylase
MENNLKLAMIGGSGIYKLENLKIKDEIEVTTPFGKPSDKVLVLEHEENEFYFLARHSRQHNISPSEINYRANIYALKKLGVHAIVSISAVGSLKEELPPTKFVLPDQFVDWTKGSRKRTFFENGIVAHVSNADPVDKNLQNIIASSLESSGVSFSKGGSYICIEGPQFSTRFESKLYKSMGIDIIGMTNVPESFLAKEAGISYATLAMVTDYDGWKQEHCTLEEIMKVMEKNYSSVQKFVPTFLKNFRSAKFIRNQENQTSVVTPKEYIPENYREIIDVLLA